MLYSGTEGAPGLQIQRAPFVMSRPRGCAMSQPLGDLLDNLGVTAHLEDGELIASAVVVLSIMVPGDNEPRLLIANSDGIGWINQAGLLRLAERICSEPPAEDD